jgi:hypothetical protein
MTDMTLRSKIGIALVLLAAVLYIVPPLVPVDPHMTHDTRGSVVGNESQIEAEGHQVVAYEELSPRGQELYVKTLRNDGEYSVPLGDGAPDFDYPTERELDNVDDHREREQLASVVIERPPDADLPPADEPVEQIRAERREQEQEGDERPEAAQRRFPNASVVARYDMMSTRTQDPSLGATPNLVRLLAALLAVVSAGAGGYLLSSK